jgi:hypothetical protein
MRTPVNISGALTYDIKTRNEASFAVSNRKKALMNTKTVDQASTEQRWLDVTLRAF